MFKGINFNCLYTYGTVVFSDPDFVSKALKLCRFDNTISQFLAYFHCA